MIENDIQMAKAQKAIAYWHDVITNGGGSWLGNENARTEILKLRKEIAEYERRKKAGAENPTNETPTSTSPASSDNASTE